MNIEKAESFLNDLLKQLQSSRKRWCTDCVDDAEDMLLEYPDNIEGWITDIEDVLEKPHSYIIITSAIYGHNDKVVDVKNIIEENLYYNKIPKIVINNLTMKCDPAPGIVKNLNLTYTYSGVSYMKIVKEGETLSIHLESNERINFNY